jgi:hypothetical protein
MACDPEELVTEVAPILGKLPPGLGKVVGGGKIKIITGKGGGIGFNPALCQPEIDGAFVVTGGGDKFDCYKDKEGGDAGRLNAKAGVEFTGGWLSSDGSIALGDTFNTYEDGDGSTQTLNAGTGLMSSWIHGEGFPVVEGDFRFIRLLVSANNGDSNFTGIIEMELRESFGGPTVTVGGTASANGFLAGFEPAKAFDGSLASGDGWAIQNLNVFPVWLQYDFGVGETRRIVQYQVGSHVSATSTNARSCNAWLLQGSNNGSDWTSIHQVTGQTGWTFPEMRTFPL